MNNALLPNDLTLEQQDVINGKLLGDGWLEPIRKRVPNSSFRVQHCSQQLEYVQFICNVLQPFSLSIKRRVRRNPFANKKHHAKLLHSDVLTTRCSKIFTNLRHIWYPNGTKCVPSNIELNWRTIAFWYGDDGSNANR